METALEAVLTQAREHNATKVHRVVLRVGALAGVELDALRFAFGAVTRGTAASEADLELETVPARGRCADCDLEFDVRSDFIFTCPKCGRISGELVQGRELELRRIEMS